MSLKIGFQVGAVIVNQDKRIVGSGYNGMPTGCSDDMLPWGKGSENFLENKSAYVCHAEMNAILNKIVGSIKGSTIYTVLFPCNECAKLIIQVSFAWIEHVKLLRTWWFIGIMVINSNI